MHTALRAGALLIVAGLTAGAILIFATDQAEAPKAVEQKSMAFSLTSPAFENGATIPGRYTCDGANVSPPLSFVDVPPGAQSIVLIMEDPDVPKQVKPDGVFDHWVLFNIPATTTELAEGASAGVFGANGAGKAAYTGPCPPTQYEPSTHRYYFRAYALDTMLPLRAKASKSDVMAAMERHVLSEAELMGRYHRIK